jgi:DNA-binding HxlR family transcriptional regulator
MEAGSSGTGSEGRTGARILRLLAAPASSEILRQLSRGPRRLSELRREADSIPPTTLRARLTELSEVGVVVKRRLNPFPSVREYELTRLPGRELLFVATTLESWLASAPERPLASNSDAGRATIRALLESWSSTMLRALAADSASLADLDRQIGSLSHSSLERRLGALRLARLIEAREDGGGAASYEITDWLRKGTAPIAAAARWERRHIPHGTAPIAPIDAETGFLLAMPLLKPPPELAGSCRLGVEFGDGNERCLAGVTVQVERGRIVSCTTHLESSPAAWATGPSSAWLRTAIEADPNRLELGGDRRLVHGLLDGLNQALFGPARPLPPRL